eukprot:COSAG05_NODE_88_length_20344_cov_12.094690_4_plen_316_part_00
MFQSFDYTLLDHAFAPAVARICYICYVALVHVIMLNMLIALMTSVYEDYSERLGKTVARKERAKLLAQYEVSDRYFCQSRQQAIYQTHEGARQDACREVFSKISADKKETDKQRAQVGKNASLSAETGQSTAAAHVEALCSKDCYLEELMLPQQWQLNSISQAWTHKLHEQVRKTSWWLEAIENPAGSFEVTDFARLVDKKCEELMDTMGAKPIDYLHLLCRKEDTEKVWNWGKELEGSDLSETEKVAWKVQNQTKDMKDSVQRLDERLRVESDNRDKRASVVEGRVEKIESNVEKIESTLADMMTILQKMQETQ